MAFAVLFVGIGVDFGIQFSVRYKAERFDYPDFFEALAICAASKVGRPLALAAIATMAGFYAFLPTTYRGVSELGEIAGTGMLIAFISFDHDPPGAADDHQARAPRESRSATSSSRPADDFIDEAPLRDRHRHARLWLWPGLPLLRDLRFDFNPLNLDSQTTEAVSTLFWTS